MALTCSRTRLNSTHAIQPSADQGKLNLKKGTSRRSELIWQGQAHVDDLTGLPLPEGLSIAARKKEVDYFHDNGVSERRNVSEAIQRTGKKPISVRWVETNKGDDLNPNIRSILVVRDIRKVQLRGN